ncbi:MAG: electron transport complex subunit RsxC [Thiobacillaceae bacterium]|nr:electron transport complex subunit RsxC [Thiobacillaceae bacterium]MDW8322460.1 electron transport complex subunit RsxC [Burkholderiales bacterium]
MRFAPTPDEPRLTPFPGGIRLPAHKEVSTQRPIAALPLLPLYVVPLRQHIGEPARPIVQAGDRVLRGQMIGRPEGYVSVGVHAPTSGRVLAVEPRPVPHPSGLADLCVVIEADGEDRAVEPTPLDWHVMDASSLRNRLREMGLAGLGGAVFPSFIKLNPGARRSIPILILNGAECEPWITCDDLLMRQRASEILLGAQIMRHMLGAQQVLVGIEDNKPQAIASMMEAAIGSDIRVVAVPSIYPAGGGKQLTYLLTGRETPAHGLTTDVGVQVFNVGTAYALYRAVVHGEPLTSRIVTVTGHVAAPGNFEVRLGTPIADLLAAAGGELTGATGRVIGGPMMGFELKDTAAPVTKAVNCVLVKDAVHFPPPPPALPCIRCGACARACPMRLSPHELYWYARHRDFGKTQALNLFDCIECGCCSYVCPSHIPLVDYYRFAKSEIWAREREKKAADEARARHEFRLQRLEREKQEKAERLAKKAAERLESGAVSAQDPDAERKRAILAAAIEKARKAKEGVQPRNVDDLPEAVRKEIASIDARRTGGNGADPTP